MIGIGNFIGIGRSGSASPVPHDKMLFWGKYSEISAGQMPNKVTGSSDHLIVSGSAGNETYQCPNTSAYISADTDYLWFKMNADPRTVTTAELVGYDFLRTPVKYDNTNPYAIREIVILKSGEVLTTTEDNNLRDNMQLSQWWDNTLSLHGVVKQNRGIGRSVMIPQSGLYCDEYDKLYYYFNTKPSVADRGRQNTLLKGLVDGGYLAKSELIDIFSAHDEQDSLWNWKNPLGINPTKIGSPEWVAYEGFTGGAAGTATDMINLNFNPSTDGTLIGKDNICVLIGCGSNIDEAHTDHVEFGGSTVNDTAIMTINSRYFDNIRVIANSVTGDIVANSNGKKHVGFSRSLSTEVDVYSNKTKTTKTRDSTALVNAKLYACGFNYWDAYPTAGGKNVRYVMIFSALSEAEVGAVIDLVEAYLDNYSTGLI